MLADKEYEIIKSHTTKGYEALKDISTTPEFATVALSYQVAPVRPRLSGRSHGRRDTGGAEIIAVADCFATMYTNRPYRKRMNFEKAVPISSEGYGTQLLPRVVNTFLEIAMEFTAANNQMATAWRTSKPSQQGRVASPTQLEHDPIQLNKPLMGTAYDGAPLTTVP